MPIPKPSAARRAPSTRRERGQASVELVALLPLLAVVAGLLWQAVIAGQAVWLAGTAARAAARAHALGEDARAAARATLPRSLATATIVDAPPGEPTVTIRIPVPSIVGATHLVTVTAHASLAAQR